MLQILQKILDTDSANTFCHNREREGGRQKIVVTTKQSCCIGSAGPIFTAIT